jgi:hypothetical protein
VTTLPTIDRQFARQIHHEMNLQSQACETQQPTHRAVPFKAFQANSKRFKAFQAKKMSSVIL